MTKLKRIIIALILTISLVVNPTLIAYAGNDPAPGESPTPSPSVEPAPAADSSPAPSPTPDPSDDTNIPPSGESDQTDQGTPNQSSSDDDDYRLTNEEKDQRWQEYQNWLASQNPGSQDSTGGVSGGGNVGDTSINTGDANAAGAVVTAVNTTAVSAPTNSCSACPSNSSATNSANGSGSDNSATINNNNNSTIVIDNDANVANNLDFDANSGFNDASKNVGDSEIITGDANVVLTVITEANEVGLGVYQFDVNGNHNGDVVLDSANAVAQNILNASNSTNDATVNNTNTNVETITNDGDITNNIDIFANTGYNEASKNVGNSTIETGDANVVANVVNALNTVVDGAMNVVNIFGDMVGNIVQPTYQASATDCSCSGCPGDVTASNIANGSDSQNNAEVNETNTNTTNMTNNATVANNLNLDGNTGGNSTSDNVGFSSVETGDVNVDANVINIANVNVSAGSCDPIYFVFINDVSGDWQGQILGAAPGTYFYTSDGSIYFVDQNGQLVAMNKDNGSGSTNNSTINNTNTNTTDITNNGTITNNINIDANTGKNEASDNTRGESSITTGDANIAVNVINFINSNFSGRKVVMTLVNVFGSWVGNFVPAGYTGEIPQVGGANVSASSPNNSGGSSSSSGGNSSSSSGGASSQTSGQIASGVKVAGIIGGNFFSGGSSSGDVNGASSGDSGAQVQSITTYRAAPNPFDFGMPIVVRMAIAFAILSLGTILLRKKAALKIA